MMETINKALAKVLNKPSKKPEFKLLPCVFCTIGFNCYVAGHKLVSAAYDKVTQKQNPTANKV